MKTEWLDIMVCPATRSKLRLDPTGRWLISDAAGVAYPIREGVPVMLIEAAVAIDTLPAAN